MDLIDTTDALASPPAEPPSHPIRADMIHDFALEPIVRVSAYISKAWASRPTVSDLLSGRFTHVRPRGGEREREASSESAPGLMGWFFGVFIRVTVSIFGVVMFLRMNWMVGEAGLGLCLVIVLISVAVTCTVALSASALCSNGRMLSGGPYVLASSSLGIEAGHVIALAGERCHRSLLCLSAYAFHFL